MSKHTFIWKLHKMAEAAQRRRSSRHIVSNKKSLVEESEFTLNSKKSLKKKRNAETKEDITITGSINGHNDQITLSLSSTSYTYVVDTFKNIFHMKESTGEVELTIKEQTDKQKTVYCYTMKIAYAGCAGHVTLNFYPTTCRVLINGNTEYVRKELQHIQSTTQNSNSAVCEDSKELNKAISSFLNSQEIDQAHNQSLETQTTHDSSQTCAKQIFSSDDEDAHDSSQTCVKQLFSPEEENYYNSDSTIVDENEQSNQSCLWNEEFISSKDYNDMPSSNKNDFPASTQSESSTQSTAEECSTSDHDMIHTQSFTQSAVARNENIYNEKTSDISRFDKIEESICDLLVMLKEKSADQQHHQDSIRNKEKSSVDLLLKNLEKKINQITDTINKKFSDINKKIDLLYTRIPEQLTLSNDHHVTEKSCDESMVKTLEEKINHMSNSVHEKLAVIERKITNCQNSKSDHSVVSSADLPAQGNSLTGLNLNTDSSPGERIMDTFISDDQTSPLIPDQCPNTIPYVPSDDISLNWDIFLDDTPNTGSSQQTLKETTVSTEKNQADTNSQQDMTQEISRNLKTPSLLLIGDSNVRYIDPNRLITGKKVRKVLLRNKTLFGATKYVSNMTNAPPFLHIQCGGNDIEYKSEYTIENNIKKLFDTARKTIPNTHVSFSVVYHRSVSVQTRTSIENKIKRLSASYNIEYISLLNISNDNSYFCDDRHLNNAGLAKTVQLYKYSMYPKHGLSYTYKSDQLCLESADDLIDLRNSRMYFNSRAVDLVSDNQYNVLADDNSATQ